MEQGVKPQVGQLVTLKSGSNPFVVQNVFDRTVEVVWFANGETHCAEFRVEVLEAYEKP